MPDNAYTSLENLAPTWTASEARKLGVSSWKIADYEPIHVEDIHGTRFYLHKIFSDGQAVLWNETFQQTQLYLADKPLFRKII